MLAGTVASGTSVGGAAITTGVWVIGVSDPPQAMAANAAKRTIRPIPIRPRLIRVFNIAPLGHRGASTAIVLFDYSNGLEGNSPTG